LYDFERSTAEAFFLDARFTIDFCLTAFVFRGAIVFAAMKE
jgi:hypothetical protein